MDDLTQPRSWRAALSIYWQPSVVVMFFLGFSAGLPLLLVFSTLTAWLTDEGISRSTIGFFAWVGITYSIKVFWAPVVDQVGIRMLTPLLGKRRSWLLLAQLGVVSGLVVMSVIDVSQSLSVLVAAALVVAFSSATQDVVIDAYRIERAAPEYQAALATTYSVGYRVAMLVAGAGSLFIAEAASWSTAYSVMAVIMLLCIVTTLVIAEPDQQLTRQEHGLALFSAAWWKAAVILPFVDFFKRNGLASLLILLFIGLFRLSDIVMGIMANPFYLDVGFTKGEIAKVSKVFGLIMTLVGSLVGGLFVVRYKVAWPLVIAALGVALTNLLFAKLATIGPAINWLFVTIGADNVCAGFAGAVFIAYLSGLTNRAYTATQYALFSSLMTLPGKFVSGFSGMVVDAQGYSFFFIYAALMGIPAVVMALIMARYRISH